MSNVIIDEFRQMGFYAHDLYQETQDLLFDIKEALEVARKGESLSEWADDSISLYARVVATSVQYNAAEVEFAQKVLEKFAFLLDEYADTL